MLRELRFGRFGLWTAYDTVFPQITQVLRVSLTRSTSKHLTFVINRMRLVWFSWSPSLTFVRIVAFNFWKISLKVVVALTFSCFVIQYVNMKWNKFLFLWSTMYYFETTFEKYFWTLLLLCTFFCASLPEQFLHSCKCISHKISSSANHLDNWDKRRKTSTRKHHPNSQVWVQNHCVLTGFCWVGCSSSPLLILSIYICLPYYLYFMVPLSGDTSKIKLSNSVTLSGPLRPPSPRSLGSDLVSTRILSSKVQLLV